jgi:hypothetical protein
MTQTAERARAHCRLLVLYSMAVALFVVMVVEFSETKWEWGLVFLGLCMVSCGGGVWYESIHNEGNADGDPRVFYSVFWGRNFRYEDGHQVWL